MEQNDVQHDEYRSDVQRYEGDGYERHGHEGYGGNENDLESYDGRCQETPGYDDENNVRRDFSWPVKLGKLSVLNFINQFHKYCGIYVFSGQIGIIFSD